MLELKKKSYAKPNLNPLIGKPSQVHKIMVLFIYTIIFFFFFFLRFTNQDSHIVHLVKGERYYAELLLREKDYADHVGLKFLNPETSQWCAMTHKFLEKYR